MPSLSIPPRELRRWTGPYLGDYYGVLWKTSGVDLDKREGKIMLSRRMQRIQDTGEVTGDAVYSAFIRTDADCTDRYWGLRLNEGLAKTDSSATPLPSDSWDTDAIASSPATPRDFTVGFNDSRNDSGRNKLWVTKDSGDIAVLNDSGDNTWTASWWITKHSQTAMDTTVLFRPIDYFPFRKITVVASGNLIHTISRPSDTVNDTLTNSRLTIPKDLNAHHIFHTNNREWILTHNKNGGEAKIVEWDGSTSSYNDIHNVYGMAALSGVDYYGTPIVLNDRGKFLEFTGGGFTPMIRNGQEISFPLPEGASLISGKDTSMVVSVVPKGMSVGEDGLIHINVKEGTVAGDRFEAGIWCLNPINGRLYNKTNLGRWGDSTDYGHKNISRAGGLAWIPSSVSSRNLLAGGIINVSVGGTAQTGIWLQEAETSTTFTRGYFITQFIPASEIQDQYDSIWVLFKRFMTTGSQVILKARGTRGLYLANRRPLSATITWTSTTTFTLTLAAGDDSLAVGDEVEVLNGVNAGYLAHITTISGAHAAIQTITIDETITTGSSTSIARFERWKKLGVISNTSKYEDNLSVPITSSFLQIKGEIRGLANEQEISSMVLNFNTNLQNKK